MSKARITYRFEYPQPMNGQASAKPEAVVEQDIQEAAEPEHVEFPASSEPILIEEEPPAKSSPSALHRPGADYPYDYGAWYDPADAEADELERIIRSTGVYDEPPGQPRREQRRRAGADPRTGPELDEETGYWRYEEADAYRQEPPAAYRRPPQDGPAWWKVVGSVIGAVATGMLFGAFILNLFTGTAGPPQVAEQPAAADGAGEVTQPPAPSGAEGAAVQDPSGTADALSGSAALHLPERRMWLLQNGVFESLESARALANDMKEKGFAGTIEEGTDFYVYAGITSDRDAALRTGLLLQDSGIEVYVKPYDLPAVQEVRLSDEGASALGAFMEAGSQLVQMIGDLTLIHLDGEAPVAPEKSSMDKLKSDHFAFTERSANASAALGADVQPMLKRMEDAVRNAVIAMEEYAEHPDTAYLWSAQESLIDYIIAEKKLLQAVASDPQN